MTDLELNKQKIFSVSNCDGSLSGTFTNSEEGYSEQDNDQGCNITVKEKQFPDITVKLEASY